MAPATPSRNADVAERLGPRREQSPAAGSSIAGLGPRVSTKRDRGATAAVIPAAHAVMSLAARSVWSCRDRKSSGEVPIDAIRRRSRAIPSGNRGRGQTIRIPARHRGRPSWLVWPVPPAHREPLSDRRSLLDAGHVAASPRDLAFAAPGLGGIHRIAEKYSPPRNSSRVRSGWYRPFRRSSAKRGNCARCEEFSGRWLTR